MRPLARLLSVLLSFVVLGLACKSDPDPIQDLGPEPDQPLPVDFKRADEPFGRACSEVGKECKDKDPEGHTLLCVGVKGGAAGQGFCTRQCTDVGDECYGVPNGQSAFCILSEAAGPDAGVAQKKYCAFLCRSKANVWICPATLKCGPVENESAICVP